MRSMSIMSQSCFMCTGEIQRNDFPNSEENSFLLCQILEIPNLRNNVNTFNEISYCPGCLGRIFNIRDMLEDLERLEKKILDEKYLIENQLKKNSRKINEKGGTPKNSSADEMTIKVGAELTEKTIQSMLKKIRKKQVGRTVKPRQPVRIMKNVTIPKTQTVENGRNFQKSGDPIQRPASGMASGIFVCQESPIYYHESFLLGNHLEMQSNSGTESRECLEAPAPLNMCQTNWTDCEVEDVCIDINHDINSTLADERNNHLDVAPASEYIWETNSNPHDPVTAGTSTEWVPNSVKSEVGMREESDVTEFINVQEMAGGSGNSKAFICGTCGISFDHYNQLLIHDQVHLETNIDATNQKNNRKQSQNLTLPSSRTGRERKCEECGKMLSTPKTLRNHIMQVHRKQHKLKCPLCNFGCQVKANLRDHMTAHSDVRNFRCHLCPSTFKRMKNLKSHLKIHAH